MSLIDPWAQAMGDKIAERLSEGKCFRCGSDDYWGQVEFLRQAAQDAKMYFGRLK